MRKVWKFALGLVVGLGVLAGNAGAQFKNGSQPTELNIPRVSQRGTVSQRIGLTDITITYHRPAVGGREIWGKTVPYGKVWRAGANENTTITVSSDVSVEGKPLAAGTYGLHTIPDKDQWTVIFSKNSTSWGRFSWGGYDEAAQWCLDNNYNLEEALKWEDTSIQNEARFENYETKSRILDAMGRKEDSAKVLSAALDKANAIQLYSYARGLQRQGNAKRAFELYPQVPQKDRNHWISHLALARITSNTVDFTAAAKEMTAATNGAPETTKPFLQPLLKRLEAKDDINK